MADPLGADPGFGQCVGCGEAWFELRHMLDDDRPYNDGVGPAVCIDRDGVITGFAGRLVCVGCGADWVPGGVFRGGLRVVKDCS